jgi:nucleotide-binding universal stress UspA family protein
MGPVREAPAVAPSSSQWRIVVGIDGSVGGRHALEWARDEAVLHGGSLDAVHVWAPPAPVSEVSAMASFADEPAYEKAARDLVAAAKESLTVDPAGPLAVAVRAERGYPPSAVLLDQASAADLLVVGTRGHGGFAGLLLGSTSQQVVHHATRPVAIVPPTAPLPDQGDVVVGVDGSEGSAHALRWAVDEAASRGARLSVVHGWWTPYPIPPGGLGLAPADPEQFTAQSQKLLQEMVDDAVTRAGRSPSDLELLPIQEPAAPALLDRARDAALLVVGSRGRGGFTGLLLGSTSQQCVHHATCAVVVVPNPA